jgi:serine protease AprX
MRAAAQPNVVAEVAGHSDLQTLDIPRRMVREMNVAAVTINGPEFRQRLNVSGRGIRVAVIDGEVNVNHPALAGRVTLQENFTKEAFGNPDGHGTAVAGIIGAADAMFGGMAPDATIINYKVFRSDDAVGDEFQGILAVQHALQDGADIANCSWGTGPTGDGTSREARAFNTAWTQGLILIKSSGNAGPGAGSMTSPADADGVIVVAATNRQGTDVPDYSSRGPSANGKHPHLAAPGGTQFSGINTCLANVQSGNFGDAGFGTSFAAPMIAGAAALLRQQTPNITPDQVRDRLVGICRAFAGNDPNLYGAGILDLSAFV